MSRRLRLLRRLAAVVLVVTVAAASVGCSGGSPILANPPASHRSVVPAATAAPAPNDPQPIDLARDDAPHDRLTEWWYYTGHLRSADGRRFGFEYVIFRAERGVFPVSWVSHLAITDESSGRFHYSQRLEIGPSVDRSTPGSAGTAAGFDLAIRGTAATTPQAGDLPAWTMTGVGGNDRLTATLAPDEAALAGTPGGLGLDLALRATKPPVLHDHDGWIDFGPAGGSYYYSRTAMAAAGTVTMGELTMDVEGIAWFDHQWGDFISVGGAGWDWFAVNLDDGTDLTLSLVRDMDGNHPLIYGTLVGPRGDVRHLDRDAFTVEVSASWTSLATGAEYPAGWIIEVPGDELTIQLTPTVAAQELDTRATTGVVYWEGSQVVRATRAGTPFGGRAYVELTGYAGQESP